MFNHEILAVTAAKLLQSCPTLRDPREGSPPGSPVPGILQARTLEWVVISFSNIWKCHFLLQHMKVKVKSLSRVQLFVTAWTAAYQVPPSMGFCRQEYWSGVPSPSPVVCYCLVAKSCLFCDPMDYNGLPFPSPSLILEWVAISFSIINACKMAIFLILSFLLLLLAGIFL